MKTAENSSNNADGFEREKARQQKLLTRRYARLERTIDILNETLRACLAWEETHHLAELLQANLYRVEKGMKSLDVEDWQTGASLSIALAPPLPPNKQVDALFKKARKLKRGIGPTQKQLESKKSESSKLKEQLQLLALISEEEELKQFSALHGTAAPRAPSKTKESEMSRTPYYKYLSSKGIEILVGKKAKDNERLTFHIAHGSDWWLHVSGRPGSHVVIRSRKGEAPDPQTICEACQLAIAHSKAKGEGGAEVVITQQKYLSRPKNGPAGSVFISKHQKRWVEFDGKIVDQLKKVIRLLV